MRTNPLKFSGARRRMSVFSVCRQGLTALTVVFMFMACDQLAPTGGGEKRMVQEPIIQDLGGGMLAEITVDSNDKIYFWADYRANETDKTMDRLRRYEGLLVKVGDFGYYWSGSACDNISYGQPVRCVKME